MLLILETSSKIVVHAIQTDHFPDFEMTSIIKANCNIYKSSIFLEAWFIRLSKFQLNEISSDLAKYAILIWLKHPHLRLFTIVNRARNCKPNLYHLLWICVHLHIWWEISNKFETFYVNFQWFLCAFKLFNLILCILVFVFN